MNLALLCDGRTASERARCDTRFLKLGLHPCGGHTWMYRRIAGPQTVTAAVLLGQVMDGKEAERVGLVHRCVPDVELLDHCIDMARASAEAPRDPVMKIKASSQEHADSAHQQAGARRQPEPPTTDNNPPPRKGSPPT